MEHFSLMIAGQHIPSGTLEVLAPWDLSPIATIEICDAHEVTRVRERGMRRFKSMIQVQRFVTPHAAIQNLFNLGRHLVRAKHYRDLRASALVEWNRTVA